MPASVRLRSTAVKIELRGAERTCTKNNMRSMSVSGAARGKGRISQVWWHHTDSQHLRGELVPCSASRGGLGMRQQGQGMVFKNTGGLPELAHRETWESQGCCNGWRWVEAKGWHFREEQVWSACHKQRHWINYNHHDGVLFSPSVSLIEYFHPTARSAVSPETNLQHHLRGTRPLGSLM